MSEGGRFRQMLLFEDGVRNERATEDKRGKLLSVFQGLGENTDGRVRGE